MTKSSSTITAALLAGALATPLTASAEARPLKVGSHGPRVQHLQRVLGLTPDGIFGPSTRKALKRFQRRHRLHADGIVGPATWDMVVRAGRKHRGHSRSARTGSTRSGSSTAKVQRRGPQVRLAQRKLGVAADGVFGPGTGRAVRRFQKAHGLPADGIVGPATWKALGVGGRHPVLKRARTGRRSAAEPDTGIPTVVWRAIAAGNRIASRPYVYGGGHASFTASGYDCSGSVSYVLHAIGRLGRPRDSGQLASYGSPGPGRWITIYANAGHVYMTIAGRRFDTSSQSPGGSRWTRESRSPAAYTVRHPPGL